MLTAILVISIVSLVLSAACTTILFLALTGVFN